MMPDTIKPMPALADNPQAFSQLSEPQRAALLAHCYRRMGSLEDAEDMVQETLVRAWKARASFAGRASFRTWLFKIVTNACLDALERRTRRSLPTWELPPAAANIPFVLDMDEAPWLGPFPDRLVTEVASDPAARYSQLESVRLAFMVALHRLPPRQRAVLLLRDVLGWRAKEAAEQLDMTLAGVNSALQRARVTLQHGYPDHNRMEESSVDEDGSLTHLVDRYMQAWEANDADALVQLLTEDASMSMPPAVMWYRGRAAIRGFLRTVPFEGDSTRRWQLRRTQANRQPALGLYRFDQATSAYRAAALQVLTVRNEGIAEVIAFVSETNFTQFGLPMALNCT